MAEQIPIAQLAVPEAIDAAVAATAASAASASAAAAAAAAIAGNYVILDAAPSPSELEAGQIGFLIPSPWLPTDFTALQLWADETVTPPADGSDYGTWYDRSGHANHLTPGNIGTYIDDIPQFDADGINGHAAVYHPNSSAMGAPANTWGVGPIVVAAVVKMGAITATSQTVWNGQNSGTSAQTLLLDRSSDGAQWRIRRSGAIVPFTHPSAADGLVHSLIAVYNGAASQLWVDGVLIGSGDPGSGTVTSFKTGIAQTSAGNKNSGTDLRIKQLVVATQVPSAAEISKLSVFLANRAAA